MPCFWVWVCICLCWVCVCICVCTCLCFCFGFCFCWCSCCCFCVALLCLRCFAMLGFSLFAVVVWFFFVSALTLCHTHLPNLPPRFLKSCSTRSGSWRQSRSTLYLRLTCATTLFNRMAKASGVSFVLPRQALSGTRLKNWREFRASDDVEKNGNGVTGKYVLNFLPV